MIALRRWSDGYDIKTTRAVAGLAVLLQVVGGGRAQALLFATVHAFDGAAVVGAGTKPHFNEDQLVLLLHDEIDFAVRAAVVRSDEVEAGLLQVLSGAPLGGGATVPMWPKARSVSFT